MVLSCLLSGFGGMLLYNADFSIYSFAPREERSVEPIIPQPDIEFDDSVYVEENWNDKASESYAGGNGTKENPYQISNAAEFAHLSVMNKASENNVKGKYFILTKDIYLNDGYFDDDGTYHDGGDGVLNVWDYLGVFAGTFDGRGFNVYGLYSRTKSLFNGNRAETSVSNMHIKKSYLSMLSGGGFFQANSGIIESCSFDGVVFNDTENRSAFGGISGTNVGAIRNCVNYGNVLGNNSAMKIGGIVGINYSGSVVENCVNYGDVGTKTTKYYVGGIVGDGSNILRCKNYGKIYAANVKVGGIVGQGSASYCENHGEVVSGINEVGGVIGAIVMTSSPTHNKNYGSVTGGTKTGGVVGFTSDVAVNISYCENYGKIKGTSYAVGGIVGNITGKVVVSNCYNSATVLGFKYDKRGAGIVGNAESGAIVQYCESYAVINSRDGKTIVGGTNDVKIYNCIGVCENQFNNKIVRQIYATDLSKFSINFKTGKIILNKGTALSVFMGRVDRELLISKGFEIIS